VCVSVCQFVCPVRALTFESIDMETSFLVRRYIFRISRPSSSIKIIRSRSRSQHQKPDIPAGGSPSIERHSCFPDVESLTNSLNHWCVMFIFNGRVVIATGHRSIYGWNWYTVRYVRDWMDAFIVSSSRLLRVSFQLSP